jgi:hypothetical protein
MIKALDGGITSATLLAETLHIPMQSVSRWAKRLQKSGLLRKDGKDYVLASKAKELTPKAESSIASEAAPVKDLQVTERHLSRDAHLLSDQSCSYGFGSALAGRVKVSAARATNTSANTQNTIVSVWTLKVKAVYSSAFRTGDSPVTGERKTGVRIAS